jgi:NAD+ diphosphatase
MARDPTSAAMPFTGMALDRVADRRGHAAWLAAALAAPSTRFVATGTDGVLLDPGGSAVARLRLPRADRTDEAILLGIDADGAAVFALDLDRLDPGWAATPLRAAAAVLPAPEAGLAAYAAALVNWHRAHGFCGRCGTPTAAAEAGFTRRCPRCRATHFPRTDPVVIMVVSAPGHVLLGRHAGWPDGRYSALAGYVSPGESLEEAVIREVREESGVRAREPAYVASQPWPFPTSLMVGFDARADLDPPPAARDGELEDVRWFPLDEVRAAGAEDGGGADGLRLPPTISIARRLIDGWVAQADSSAAWRSRRGAP